MAVRWLRRYRCGVVLSEQACVSGEMPDAIGWKKACHSVLVESKVSRADFLVDRDKPFRQRPEIGVGCERYYLAPRGLIRSRGTSRGLGIAGVVRARDRAGEGVGEESAFRDWVPERDESSAG